MAPLDPNPAADHLLALMQAGDMRALDHLARAYGARLLAVARRRCRCAGDAEDAVQQALLAARSAMTGYRGDGSPLSWLSTLVARSCHRMNQQAGSLSAPAEIPCACDDPTTLAEQRELGAMLGEALMSLSRTDRLAFLLSAEGFTSVEIAARFDLSHDAVRSRLKRARRVLRARLRAMADDTPSRAADTPAANPAAGATHAHSSRDPSLAEHARPTRHR